MECIKLVRLLALLYNIKDTYKTKLKSIFIFYLGQEVQIFGMQFTENEMMFISNNAHSN